MRLVVKVGPELAPELRAAMVDRSWHPLSGVLTPHAVDLRAMFPNRETGPMARFFAVVGDEDVLAVVRSALVATDGVEAAYLEPVVAVPSPGR